MKKMCLDQSRAPIYEALERFRKMRVVPFDVPGHKHGRGNPELTNFLGQQCMDVDVNSMKPLDNLCHPVSVIREAEELAADAFGASHAFLMVGGTTSSVQSMVLTVVSDSKDNSFTSPPSTGIGKMNTILLIQQPSFLFSGYRSILSMKAFISSFRSASVAELYQHLWSCQCHLPRKSD